MKIENGTSRGNRVSGITLTNTTQTVKVYEFINETILIMLINI